jgi:hypothetical protein
MLYLYKEASMSEEINENDVNYFKITDYDPENPVDKLFIQQEILYQKHRVICGRMATAGEGTNLMRTLEIEKNKIEIDAKENADKILKIHSQQEAARQQSLAEIKKEHPPNTQFVTKKRK